MLVHQQSADMLGGVGHRDGEISARMAEQAKETGTVVDLQLAASAKQAETQRQMNCVVLLKLS